MKNIIKEKRAEVNMTITMFSKLISTSEETLLSWESGVTESSIPEMIRLS